MMRRTLQPMTHPMTLKKPNDGWRDQRLGFFRVNELSSKLQNVHLSYLSGALIDGATVVYCTEIKVTPVCKPFCVKRLKIIFSQSEEVPVHRESRLKIVLK